MDWMGADSDFDATNVIAAISITKCRRILTVPLLH
jgi:hypothetical protein